MLKRTLPRLACPRTRPTRYSAHHTRSRHMLPPLTHSTRSHRLLTRFLDQAGRAGRSGRSSISFYVAFEDPLNQHFVTHAAELLHTPPERAVINTDNAAVTRAHLLLAAVEHPLTAGDAVVRGLLL